MTAGDAHLWINHLTVNLTWERAVEYFYSIKGRKPIAQLFGPGASIVSHKLGVMSVGEYERRLADSADEVDLIRICRRDFAGSLMSLYIQLDFKVGGKFQYVDVFEFDRSLLIKRLYLCRVSDASFDGDECLLTI
ncbi:hypothetical protein PAN31117_05240 [Pandoraea anapnoica]|uniref:SnoaL-like domain-containing protein n=1 Tax=Pandoraea anapnoica TaxID=2508301 RepID=A0A5E5APN8_9BURK|nr:MULTISPECIES: hypothetical protein [Pandoraea]VVE59293.1 hypothetical protein PIN31009_05488 [Pandoraea iniqua]VVE75751.1 hypothetical protein PAN31117_05240 [Pandoraea anapnoica]